MTMPETIHDLFEKVRAHPDFAGGTIFTRADVARALHLPDGEAESVPAELIASITDEQMSEAVEIIYRYIFDDCYSWVEALRDFISR